RQIYSSANVGAMRFAARAIRFESGANADRGGARDHQKVALSSVHQTVAPNSLSLPSNSARISPRVFGSRASKRITSAGSVLDARTRPHPPGKFTRAPS